MKNINNMKFINRLSIDEEKKNINKKKCSYKENLINHLNIICIKITSLKSTNTSKPSQNNCMKRKNILTDTRISHYKKKNM